MGMQVDRDVHRRFQGRNQQLGSIGLEQAGHILEGQHVSARVFQPPSHIKVILQIVAVARLLVQHITGITDGGLGNASRAFTYDLDRALHSLDPVQRIENAEHIDAVIPALFDEFFDQIIRVSFVTHRIGAPEQHLKQNIGYRFA